MLQKLGSKKPKNLISILGLSAGAIGLADLAISEADTQNTFVSPSHYEKLDDGTVLLTLTTGENISLSNDQYVITEDGVLLIVDQLAQAAVSQLPVWGSLRLPNYSDAAPVRSEAGEIIQVSSQNPLWSGDDKAPRLFQEIKIQRFELAQNPDDSSSTDNETSGSNVGIGIAAGGFASLAVIASALSATDTGSTQTSAESEASTPAEPFSAYLVKDINPTGGSTPVVGGTDFYAFGDELYFIANDGTHGIELWRTDGTAGGTSLLKDINDNPASADSWAGFAVQVDDKLFFKADDGENGVELWVTDGTEAGTVMVKNINPSSDGLTPDLDNFAVEFNGSLLFGADDGSPVGQELWISDGTDAGTLLLYDINQTADFAGTEIGFVGQINGLQLVSADMGANGSQLWVTNGTTHGTELLKDIEPSEGVLLGDKLYFAADDGVSGYELWVTDGTSVGTTMLKDINVIQGQGSDPNELRIANDLIFFAADDGTGSGNGLWVTDGTSAGTKLLKEFELLDHGVAVDESVEFNGVLYFIADDGVNGRQMWVSDGTEAGTQMVPNELDNEWDMTPALGSLFFNAEDGSSGIELWVTDGTIEGTYLTTDINASGNSFPESHTAFNDRLFFVADDGSSGFELWAVM